MNLLQSTLQLRNIYTVGVARALCRRLHCYRKLSIVMPLSTTFTQCAPENTKFGKITQNKGHFAVQGYSRSPIFVPNKSSYTASYIKTIAKHVLCIKYYIYKSAKNLYRRREAVFFQTLITTSYSNRKCP